MLLKVIKDCHRVLAKKYLSACNCFTWESVQFFHDTNEVNFNSWRRWKDAGRMCQIFKKRSFRLSNISQMKYGHACNQGFLVVVGGRWEMHRNAVLEPFPDYYSKHSLSLTGDVWFWNWDLLHGRHMFYHWAMYPFKVHRVGAWTRSFTSRLWWLTSCTTGTALQLLAGRLAMIHKTNGHWENGRSQPADRD